MKENKKRGFPLVIVGIVIGIVIAVAVVGILWYEEFRKTEDKIEITSVETDIIKIIEENQLCIKESFDDNLVTIKDKKGKEEYLIIYNAVVKAGIDINELKDNIIVDNDEKIIKFIMPKIEIEEPKIEMGARKYIYTKSKGENINNVKHDAKECQKDCKRKLKNEQLKQNIKNKIEYQIEELLIGYEGYKFDFQW